MFPVLLLQLVAALVIVGLILWALTQIPMDPTIAKIIRVLVIVCVGVWSTCCSAWPGARRC